MADDREMSDLDDLAGAIGRRLTGRGETLAVAETSTGGLIGATLACQPGVADWLAGSIVAYAQSLQIGWLSVAPGDLRQFGAVSPETSKRLAIGVRQRFASDWAIAETGIAGPRTGRRSAKPAGLAYVAAIGPGVERQGQVETGRDHRLGNKAAFARRALESLLEALDQAGAPAGPTTGADSSV